MPTGISELMGGWCGWCRVFPHPNSGDRNGCPPPGVASFSPQRRPSPGSPVRGFGLTSRPARLRGCEFRSRATRWATPEPLRGRHEPGRARPSRWAGRGRERREAARAVSGAFGEEAPQPLRHGDHPLSHGHRRDDVIDKMRGGLGHVAAVAPVPGIRGGGQPPRPQGETIPAATSSSQSAVDPVPATAARPAPGRGPRPCP